MLYHVAPLWESFNLSMAAKLPSNDWILMRCLWLQKEFNWVRNRKSTFRVISGGLDLGKFLFCSTKMHISKLNLDLYRFSAHDSFTCCG